MLHFGVNRRASLHKLDSDPFRAQRLQVPSSISSPESVTSLHQLPSSCNHHEASPAPLDYADPWIVLESIMNLSYGDHYFTRASDSKGQCVQRSSPIGSATRVSSTHSPQVTLCSRLAEMTLDLQGLGRRSLKLQQSREAGLWIWTSSSLMVKYQVGGYGESQGWLTPNAPWVSFRDQPYALQ
jgi:hypothetical protein